jgi:hypothetical protein
MRATVLFFSPEELSRPSRDLAEDVREVADWIGHEVRKECEEVRRSLEGLREGLAQKNTTVAIRADPSDCKGSVGICHRF